MPIEVLEAHEDQTHRNEMLTTALAIRALQVHDRHDEIKDWLETALAPTADGTLATIDYRIAAANVSVFGFDAQGEVAPADHRLALVMGHVLHRVADITPRHTA